MATQNGFEIEPPDDADSQHGGTEVLLLDSDARVRSGLCKLLATSGVVTTATDDRTHALSLFSQKHFAVAVLDLDTPEPDAGFEIMAEVKQRSPATNAVLLTIRQTFAVAVSAFRQGACDVIHKAPENVNYLSDVVLRLCSETAQTDARARLLNRTLEVHEEFLQRLLEASRRAVLAEEKLGAGGGDQELHECIVLVVDDNPNTAPGLQAALSKDAGFRVVSLQTGGEALDFAGRSAFQLALVKDGLPDLPSSMVAKSMRAETSEGIVLMFSHPTEDRAGRATIIEISQSIELIPELTSGEQLVEQIHELRHAYLAKATERRYLQRFRSEHYDFLRRYVEVRQAIAEHLPRAQPAGTSKADRPGDGIL